MKAATEVNSIPAMGLSIVGGRYDMNLITCQEYAKTHSVSLATVTAHARKLGIKKIAGSYVFTPKEVKALEGSIKGTPGRPRKNG